MDLNFNTMISPESYLETVSAILQKTQAKRQKLLAADPGADVSQLDFEIANLKDGYDYALENATVWNQQRRAIYGRSHKR